MPLGVSNPQISSIQAPALWPLRDQNTQEKEIQFVYMKKHLCNYKSSAKGIKGRSLSAAKRIM